MVVLLLSSNLDIRILTLGNLLQYHVQYYYIIIIILSIIESLYYIIYLSKYYVSLEVHFFKSNQCAISVLSSGVCL